MKALRWAGALFLIAGIAAAPLNLLHAHFFSGAQIARVPLQRIGPVTAPQSYAPLIINLTPAQNPVVFSLEAEYFYNTENLGLTNRYAAHLISGSSIAAKADAALAHPGKAGGPQQLTTLTLLRAKINTPGVYSVLVSETAPPGIVLTNATLTVGANARRTDIVNVLAGFAFMLIGVVTLFATGKRRVR